MQGAVGVSAAGWVTVAAGIVTLVALILLWRTHKELREIRLARRLMDPGEWRTPISPPGASQGDRGPDAEPASDSVASAPAAGATSAVETATAGRDEWLQPAEVARVEVVEGPEPLELLLELLEDDEPDTRRDAVVALAGIREPGGAERLTLILGRDPSTEVRREAVAALRGSLERRRADSGAAAGT